MKHSRFAFPVLAFSLFFILETSLMSQQSGWFWQNPLPQGNDLHSVKIVSSNVGYAFGYGGTVMKTTNSGMNWSVKYLSPDYYFSTSFFINVNTGFASGMKLNGSTTNPLISKTVDGGITWSDFTMSSTNWISSVFFFDQNTGYAAGQSGLLLKTTDCGLNWNILPTGL